MAHLLAGLAMLALLPVLAGLFWAAINLGRRTAAEQENESN